MPWASRWSATASRSATSTTPPSIDSFFAIRPDYVIEVRPSVLAESDGPMLVVGLQQIHGQQIHLPRRTIDLPDRARLERRYEQFRQAAG